MEKYCQKKHRQNNETIVCLPYDLKNIYAFFCRNYGNITFNNFLKMGYDEFIIKLNSIPETEPIHLIFKSRAININKIKDKEEKKYWREMKRINAIPDIFKNDEEIQTEIKFNLEGLGGIKNGK